ncbi:acyltransferase [Paenibacillus sp. J2TS4]|uniref:acyltransferase family protein n=1 Tax=Paenibacillus sp. J2TS4 TaxID=2807194 RepID=UPI001B0BA4F5|nr:acyltransferase [Paenibacillus sp. J2TS4]GIP34511.1 acyltransferase [Paenibacillus sp. J2TS4]
MKGNKVTYLDGVRGAAALAVVIAHYLQVFVPAVFENRPELSHFAWDRGVPKTPLNLLFNGNFAVCLFFVLSGYVLSYKFFRTRDRRMVLASFFKRYFRLAVPALASVLLAYLVMMNGWGYYADVRGLTMATMPDPYTVTPGIPELLKQGLYHTFFTYGMAYNPVLWTMTYELFGSFIVFGVLLAAGTSRLRYPVYLAGILWFHDSYYLGFWLGLLLSDLENFRAGSRVRIHSKTALACLAAAGIYLGSYPYVDPAGTVYGWLPLGKALFTNAIAYRTIGAFLLLTVMLSSRLGQRIFASRPLEYLGRVSFSLYLVHFAVLCSFSSLLFLHLSERLVYGWNVLLTTAASLPLIFVLSHLMYAGVDGPIVRLLSRISFRTNRPRASGTSQSGSKSFRQS